MLPLRVSILCIRTDPLFASEVAMGSEDDPYGYDVTTARRVAATIEPLKS